VFGQSLRVLFRAGQAMERAMRRRQILDGLSQREKEQGTYDRWPGGLNLK